MSEEQNQNENGKCKCKVYHILTIVCLILSVAALTLSILNYTGASVGNGESGKKVVISKQYDKGRSLDKAYATKKPIIVFFYTDWCGFCQRFAPTFDKITKDKRIKKNFAIAFVNCENPENQKHTEEFKIQGFPTVFVIKENKERVQLDNNTFFNDDSKEVVADKALEIIGK